MADITLSTTATIPTNTSVSVTVYEDANGDGTADNTATQSIDDGSNSYTLSGFNGQLTNDYWVELSLDTSDVTITPVVSKASVEVGSGGGGSEADQNPQTTWEIKGAKHDTNGNEYEGGGVVSRYGG